MKHYIPAKWMESGRYRHDAELGMMKQCARCLHHLPADHDFFHNCVTAVDGWHAWCKACVAHRDVLPSALPTPLRAAEYRAWARFVLLGEVGA
jgi:hypothetical protein